MKPLDITGVRVRISGNSGTGCPEGTVNTKLEPSSDALDVSFLNLTAEVGPGSPSGSYMRTCHLTIIVLYPQELSYGCSL